MFKLQFVSFLIAMAASVVFYEVFSENRVRNHKRHKHIRRDIVKKGECPEGFTFVSFGCVSNALYHDLKADYDDEVSTWSQAEHVTSQPRLTPGHRRHHARIWPHSRPVWNPNRTPNHQIRPSPGVQRTQKTLHSKSTSHSTTTPGPTMTTLPVSRAENRHSPVTITTTILFVFCVSLLVFY